MFLASIRRMKRIYVQDIFVVPSSYIVELCGSTFLGREQEGFRKQSEIRGKAIRNLNLLLIAVKDNTII